jgi:hypothetical protein
MLMLHRALNRGFVALIAVILLALGIMSFSLCTASAALDYADSVYLHEARIQVNLNLTACLDSATLSVAKDYYLSGEVSFPNFACKVRITNDNSGNVSINATINAFGVIVQGGRQLLLSDNSVLVI